MTSAQNTHPQDRFNAEDGIDLMELLAPTRARWRLLVSTSLLAGVAALSATYLISPTFTAKALFLPPQQQQSAASAAMASLGALASLGGGNFATKTSADQYISFMQSATLGNRIVERFDIQKIYEAKLRSSALAELAGNVRMAAGKKDGLISIEVDDTDPVRAANIANAYVEELSIMLNGLAVTEAQQRRAFFEKQLQQASAKLTVAQQALQSSGFSAGALKAEPKAAADAYARIKADVTSTEVKLQGMRAFLNDSAPDIQQTQATLSALRSQLAKLEQTNGPSTVADSDYVSKYREFKYHETLMELFARQFELAKVDESHEGAVIQVIDNATPPDRKSKPKRAQIAVATTLLAFLALTGFITARQLFSRNRLTAPRL